MNKNIKELKLHCGIHTLSIYSTVYIHDPLSGISHIRKAIDTKTGETFYYTKINPNKYENYKISSCEECINILNSIMYAYGVKEYKLARVDFCIDSYQNNFDELLKCNKLIVLLLALSCNLKNRYYSVDPLSLENLTVRVQSDYFEVENYNKHIESNGEDIAKNRLELRSKALIKTNKNLSDLIRDWLSKLDRTPKYFKKLQSVCNRELFKQWNLEYKSKTKNISEFTRKHQDNIYTTDQLINLYKLVGLKNPPQAVYAFNKRNKIEYFSLKDIEEYLNLIKKSLIYFSTTCTKLSA